MANLKPCPFCGMPASVWKHKYPSGGTYYEPSVLHESGCVLDHVIWCGDYETEDDLADAWNRRADANSLTGALKRNTTEIVEKANGIYAEYVRHLQEENKALDEKLASLRNEADAGIEGR